MVFLHVYKAGEIEFQTDNIYPCKYIIATNNFFRRSLPFQFGFIVFSEHPSLNANHSKDGTEIPEILFQCCFFDGNHHTSKQIYRVSKFEFAFSKRKCPNPGDHLSGFSSQNLARFAGPTVQGFGFLVWSCNFSFTQATQTLFTFGD